MRRNRRLRTATLHVRRLKQGTPSTHPILGDEWRALRRLRREQQPRFTFVFTSQRGAPFTTVGFARMIERAGQVASFLGPADEDPNVAKRAQDISYKTVLHAEICCQGAEGQKCCV